jgi:hypothetical protein
MDLRRRAWKMDPEILKQSDGILDRILEKLDVSQVVHVAPSATDEQSERAIDQEVANLNGSLFGGIPAAEIPLAAFHLDEPGEPAPVSGSGVDSFAPIAHPSTSPEPERGRAWRLAPWVLGCAMAAGLAGLVATRAFVRSTAATQPAAAQAFAATAPERVALAQDPAPSAEPAPVSVTWPGPKRGAGPRSAPRLAAAPAPAPPVAACPPAAAAHLPLVLPPPPLKPPVAFERAVAAAAIASGGLRAASCRQAGAGTIAVPVSVTFAPSGNVISVRVTGGPLIGTAEGSCVATALRGAHVPAFDGEPVAASTVVHLR